MTFVVSIYKKVDVYKGSATHQWIFPMPRQRYCNAQRPTPSPPQTNVIIHRFAIRLAYNGSTYQGEKWFWFNKPVSYDCTLLIYICIC